MNDKCGLINKENLVNVLVRLQVSSNLSLLTLKHYISKPILFRILNKL